MESPIFKKTIWKSIAIVLIALLGLLPLTTAHAGSNTVNPLSTDWGLVVETAGTHSYSFVEGPATPPTGLGSLRMTVDSTAGIMYATQKYQGVRLADLESLSYATYVTSGSGFTAIAFQINYDPDLSDTSSPKPWYGRLVYEPYRNGTVNTGAWQTWDMLNSGSAVWWASANSASPVDDVCGQSSPCTLSTILTNWPNIGIRSDSSSAILFKAGGGWSGGFDGNVDNLVVKRTGQEVDIYDFEPYLPVHNITQNTRHASIQLGVNAANVGDVLEIDPGTYAENVVVDKSLTLRGAGQGDNPAVDTILDGSTLTGMGIRLNNNVTNVTIENMRIVNYGGVNPSAGIYGNLSNHNLTIQNVTVKGNGPGFISASGGIVLNGPIDNVLINNVTAHNNWGRGIVIWNGLKTKITITNNDVRNNICCGIELQDGTASGVTLTGNTIVGNADSGMAAVGLTSGAGPNRIANNTITDNGRFGIEIKLPNGTGAATGDGSIVVENNTVSLTSTPTDLRDWAGIAVFRRGWQPGNADIPTGVIVRNNTVSGYQQTNVGSFSDGFGIVVEGLSIQVLNNTLQNNDVGVQIQAGHLPYTANTSIDGDQSNLNDDYFGRGNAPVACARTDGNTYTDNDVDYRLVGAAASDSAAIYNQTAGTYHCSIQQAIDLASPSDTIQVPDGTYIEELTISKPLTLLGPNASINPNTGTRAAEAVILPAQSGPDPFGTCVVQAYIEANNVTIKGFTFDGNNPSLTSGTLVNGVDVDACEGLASYEGIGGLVVENNIVQNITYAAMDFYNFNNSGGATSGNFIRYNRIANVGNSTIGYGIGTLIYNNFYADITDNVYNDVRVGIQTGNYYQPNPGSTGRIGNNTINAWRTGIFHNFWYSNASVISVDNNTINAIDSTGATGWNGMLLTSWQSAANTLIQDNTINIGDITQLASGYNVWNTPTTAALTIAGGSVNGGDYGVFVNNFDGYNSNANNTAIIVDGVNILDAAIAGVYVKDNPSNTNSATVYAEIKNSTLTGSATGILLDGPDASAKANNNRIYNNTAGVQNNSGNVMDATMNWWGSNNGPATRLAQSKFPQTPNPP